MPIFCEDLRAFLKCSASWFHILSSDAMCRFLWGATGILFNVLQADATFWLFCKYLPPAGAFTVQNTNTARYYALSFFLSKSKKAILEDKYNFCNANAQASFRYPIPQPFSFAHIFSVERMRNHHADVRSTTFVTWLHWAIRSRETEIALSLSTFTTPQDSALSFPTPAPTPRNDPPKKSLGPA